MTDRGTQVLVHIRESVATITLNRPERGNALTTELKRELVAAVRRVGSDEAVRAVVLTGNGPAFCVGQDLAEHAETLRTRPDEAFDTVSAHYNPIVHGLATMPKPVLASINGSCAGAGLGFALACDLRIAVSDARFRTAFTGIGLTCDSGVSASLARAIGSARASQLVLLGEPFTAEQAADWGMLAQVVAPEQLAETTEALAGRLAQGPTRAFAEAKLAIAASWGSTLDETLHREAEAQARAGATEDHRRATDSFTRRQPTTFTGQ